jgi:UDP-hydrolysing UDP-N-acetyl-D-glucosamine 2-epimerase
VKLAVLTTSRADYGLLEKLIDRIFLDPDCELCLIVSGSHVSPEFGYTIRQITHPIAEKTEVLLSSDSPEAVCKAIGIGNISFPGILKRQFPDKVVLLGDRFETFAFATAAHCLRIPIAHISGGEDTQGSLDNSFRHSISHMASYHFVYAEPYKNRLIGMGINSKRIWNFGHIGLEGIEQYKCEDERKGFLVLWHPETTEPKKIQRGQIDYLLASLADIKEDLIFCLSKGDNGSRHINDAIMGFQGDLKRVTIEDYDREEFLQILARVKAIIGNSSAGIYEAPILMSSLIINCKLEDFPFTLHHFEKIKSKVKRLRLPYKGGEVSKKILKVLKEVN